VTLKPKPKRKPRKLAGAPKVWQSLLDRFAALAHVESSQGSDYNPLLLACFYPNIDAVNPVGVFDEGDWKLHDGLNFQGEYKRIALDAGCAFGAKGISGFKMWAHHLCLHVTTEKLPYEFNGQSIRIHNLCQISARYCEWLRDQAQAPPAPLTHVGPVPKVSTKKVGRPQSPTADAEYKKAVELRKSKKKWPQIRNILNPEFNLGRSADAWRNFVNKRSKPSPKRSK
jgi:hypothetical protein